MYLFLKKIYGKIIQCHSISVEKLNVIYSWEGYDFSSILGKFGVLQELDIKI